MCRVAQRKASRPAPPVPQRENPSTRIIGRPKVFASVAASFSWAALVGAFALGRHSERSEESHPLLFATSKPRARAKKRDRRRTPERRARCKTRFVAQQGRARRASTRRRGPGIVVARASQHLRADAHLY